MKKMTRLVLVSAVLATSGLTAKIATENYKAVVTNDERIHKAYELAKKPSKAAVLEEIVDAANAEPDKRIRNAVIIEPDEPKVVRVKTTVTTSAGVSPISSVMDKKPVNKAEEFIENIAHPAEVVVDDSLDFTIENIPIQELTYEIKDIFPEFAETTEKPLTYKITLSNLDYFEYMNAKHYFFGDSTSDGSELNQIDVDSSFLSISSVKIYNKKYSAGTYAQYWIIRSSQPSLINLMQIHLQSIIVL